MFHVGRGADRLLDGVDDALFDVERRRAFIDHTDKGDGDLNIGKEIDGEPLQGRHAQHDHGQRQHQNADAVPEREKGQPHRTFYSGGACTAMPSLTRSFPETMTCSSPARPLVTSTRLSTRLPNSTGT